MTATTAAALHEIRDSLEYLPLLTTSRAPGIPQGPSQGPRSKPPVDLTPIALLEDVHEVSASWVEALMGETWSWMDWHKAGVSNNVHTLALLAPVVEDHHEAARDFTKEFSTLHRRVRDTLGEKEIKTLCPKCGYRMHEETVGWLNCHACGHEEPVSGLMERVRYSNRTLTSKEAQEAFGVEPNTLKQWVHREKLAPVGKQGRENLFAYWDVLQIARPDLAQEIENLLKMEAEASRA